MIGKLILPTGVRVYACVPWTIGENGFDDDKNVSVLGAMHADTNLDPSTIQALAFSIIIRRYCPVVVIDYGYSVALSAVMVTLPESNPNFKKESSLHKLDSIFVEKMSIANNGKVSESNLPISNFFNIATYKAEDNNASIPCSAVLLKILASPEDAKQFVDDNKDSTTIVPWTWDYSKLWDALGIKAAMMAGSDIDDATAIADVRELKTKIDVKCKEFAQLKTSAVDGVDADAAASIRSAQTLVGLLNEHASGTENLLVLNRIYARLLRLSKTAKNIIALSDMLKLDMQFSDTKTAMDDSLSALNSLLDSRGVDRK